jgi:hypothetical protein
MSTHDSGALAFPSTLRPGAAAPAACPIGAAAPRLAGFGHLLREPAAEERFRLDGQDPRQNLTRLRTVMGHLASAMARTDLEPDPATTENRGIPAGYTYLLQFMAHDLVLTSLPFWALDDRSPVMRNDRASRLQLDTLYGGGPNVCPLIFAPDDRNDGTRTRLRVGPIGLDPHNPPDQPRPLRDLVRLGVASDRVIDAGPDRRSEPLVADPRNDDHSIISQLTTLFLLFHNKVLDLLAQGGAAGAALPLTEANRRFACARDAVTLVYRTIIRQDVMPRILHPAVRALLATGGSGPLRRLVPASAGLPLEFSHGAFRFGHAMVRHEYKINQQTFALDQVLNQNSHLLPESVPLVPRWIVNWSNFFELNGAVQNYSFLLTPEYNSGLLDDRVFTGIDDTPRAGLAYRDLLSAALAGLWSVDALIAALPPDLGALLRDAALLANRPQRVAQLTDWFTRRGVPADSAALLAQDPPLPFFVLFEAENDPQARGTCLGVLGSIIVAAVIYDALDADPLGTERAGTTLGERLGALTRGLYGDDRLAGLAAITTMPALIRFVAPEQTDPPAFI